MYGEVNATTRFFEDLNRSQHEPLLQKVVGSVRFDLHEAARTEHWVLEIDRGKVRVSREDRETDLVVNSSPGMFEKLVRGEENTIAALLRGAITVTGNALLILRIERLFPGPPNSLGPRRRIAKGATG
ncbi:SCP2 sterol-binding domain-containing protein [Plantactinospora sp. KBS50]|uniref:SCP2 sterol-binding domain-containing protein n=1 Tax=Plantactinospora sp. KBS50 TaxID=2024580 RepID=UPI000BAAA188|nr:SCP2 sterol-binding domain-containing protein [Plantactinospora sp. KBS50]ASW56366.1 sterol-binding protein [Plantactinospora sp. KBS50]